MILGMTFKTPSMISGKGRPSVDHIGDLVEAVELPDPLREIAGIFPMFSRTFFPLPVFPFVLTGCLPNDMR